MAIDPARTGELCARLAKRFPDCIPHLLARAVIRAQRFGLSAKALAERECNVPVAEAETDAARKRMDRKAARILAELEIACAGPDKPPAKWLAIRSGGDPRGPCAWLRICAEDGDWMPGDGWDSAAGFPLY